MMSSEINCDFCENDKFWTIEEDEMPYRVLKCKNCSLVFVYPQPGKDFSKGHYNKNYYKEWIKGQKNKRKRMWEKRYKKLGSYRRRGHLLDVGCGDGAFLKIAKENGWNIAGTDISEFAAKYASKYLNADIFCGDLADAGFLENTFDVVTMWHVLEHVTSPKQYLREIYRIMKSDGLLIIAVPNVNDYVMKIVYRIVKHKKYKLFSRNDKEIHLYHFSKKTLKAYLDDAGFKCKKVSPDFGIIDQSKKMINCISVLFFYLFNIAFFNSFEVYAVIKNNPK